MIKWNKIQNDIEKEYVDEAIEAVLSKMIVLPKQGKDTYFINGDDRLPGKRILRLAAEKQYPNEKIDWNSGGGKKGAKKILNRLGFLVLELPYDDTHTMEEQVKQAEEMEIDSLKAAAVSRSSRMGKRRETIVKQTIRDPYIAEYAKRRANGVCQLCGEEAPFLDKKGHPYLESHHIIWLSEGGEDSISNTVGLCPNCHRKMHVVADSKDIDYLMNAISDEY